MTQEKDSGKENTVLVTGASAGIGKATASLLARNGFKVFGTGRMTTVQIATP